MLEKARHSFDKMIKCIRKYEWENKEVRERKQKLERETLRIDMVEN